MKIERKKERKKDGKKDGKRGREEMSDGTGERATAVGVTLWCGSVTHRKLLFLLGVLVHSAFFFFLLSFFLSFFLFDLFLIWKMLYLFI